MGKKVKFLVLIIALLIVIAAVGLIINNIQRKENSLQIGQTELDKCKASLQSRCTAVQKLDDSYCEKTETSILNDEVSKEECKIYISFLKYLIIEIKNDKCASVPQGTVERLGESTSSVCQQILNGIEKNDSTEIKSAVALDLYYILKAYDTKNVAECEMVSDGSNKMDCKILVSTDISYCSTSQCEEAFTKFMKDRETQ